MVRGLLVLALQKASADQLVVGVSPSPSLLLSLSLSLAALSPLSSISLSLSLSLLSLPYSLLCGSTCPSLYSHPF